jgi:hypothetical protein
MKYFTNFTFKSMKKILLSIALVAFIMLGTMSMAKAMTVTFYVQITLSDTCSTGYHGYYCVELNLIYNGSVLCMSQNCTINGSGCYPFTCNIGAIAEEPYYGVAFLYAERYPSHTCGTTTGTNSANKFYWYNEMTNISCGYAWISVTL